MLFAAGLASDADRGRVTGTVMSGLLAGILLARTFSGLVSEALGWRWVYALSAGFMPVLAAALRAMLPAREPSTTAGYGELLRGTLALPLRHATLRRRGPFQAAMFGSFTAFWTTLVTFFLGGAAGAQLSTVAWHLGGWPAVALLGGALPLLALLSYLGGGLRKERAEEAARREAQVPVAA